jgi:phage tail sheath protein FI
VWSKTDYDRGVWKAPAGTESSLIGVRRLRFGVDSGIQAELNPLGINCLRRLPGAGTVIWGARTLGGNADPQWRYLSVTRTARYIRTSIDRGTRWTVFESNEPRLWSQLRAAIDAFMNGLFRAGALQGEKPADAWFVQVGLGETMSRHDVNRGRVVMRIGCALARPAEFTVVTVIQKAAG